jgi:hypothetical protein
LLEKSGGRHRPGREVYKKPLGGLPERLSLPLLAKYRVFRGASYHPHLALSSQNGTFSYLVRSTPA